MFYGKYDFSVNCGKSRKYDIHVERFYENVVFHAVNNLDYLIDQTSRSINRLFGSSFKNIKKNHTRNSFDQYYMRSSEIKDFNALIDNKPFFDQSEKTNKQKCMKILSKCQEIMTIPQEV